VRVLATIFICSAGLLAQPIAQPSPVEIVRRSVLAADRGWKAQQTYKYTERDEERHKVVVSRVTFVNGAPFEETVAHNGAPPTPAEKRKDQEARHKLETETPAERATRLKKDEENRAFIREVPEAFDFRLIGADEIDGRPAWILEATPKPGYRSHSRYGKIFSKVKGKFWVDQQDYGWVKVDATVTEPFSMGFVARIQRGSHIFFEQTRVADGIWLPKKIEVKAEARVLFFVNHNTDEVIAYSDYRPAQPIDLASTGHR
jgi:hypothetical protein